MKTSEVLNTAADLIEERGWTRGSAGWAGHDESVGALCLEGGIMAALGVDWQMPDAINVLQACPAYVAVADHVSRHKLYLWNDQAGRTASEVIEVLRAAALVEQAREDAALLAEMGRV